MKVYNLHSERVWILPRNKIALSVFFARKKSGIKSEMCTQDCGNRIIGFQKVTHLSMINETDCESSSSTKYYIV